jgi:hypothetical protein
MSVNYSVGFPGLSIGTMRVSEVIAVSTLAALDASTKDDTEQWAASELESIA